MTKDQKNNLINFGLRLKKARERAGLTQQELADKVGTSKSMISSYENATADPRQSFVPLLTNALGISISWLMQGVEQEVDRLNDRIRDLIEIMSELSEKEQEKVLSYAEFILANKQSRIYLNKEAEKRSLIKEDKMRFAASRNIKDDGSEDAALNELARKIQEDEINRQ